MNELDSPYAASNGYADYLQQGESTNAQREPSASPGSTGRLVAEAMSACEFSDTYVAGLPIRRQGQGLKLDYDSAMDLLGFSGGEG